MLYPVEGKDLAHFDAREEGYQRVEVPLDKIEPMSWQRLPEQGKIWVDIPAIPGQEPGVSLPLPNAEYPILQSYVDVVIEGGLQYGADYASYNGRGWTPKDTSMRKLLLLAGAAAALLTMAPEPADAQGMRRGVYRGGVYRGGPVVRSYGYRRPGYVYRRGYGWGPAAVGLGVLGAAAAGAYGYADPCLRQQQVYDIYGNIVWQTVRVC